MAKDYYIGIEGASFSGKTTLLSSLAGFLLKQNVIEEYCEYAGGNKNFRSVPFTDEKDAEGNILNFIAWEKERCADAAVMKARGGPVFFDRTFFSVIALQKMLRDRYPSLPNAYEFAVQTFSEFLGKDEIRLPDKMIYIRPNDEDIFSERTKRGVSVRFFSEKETLQYLDAYYKEILDIFYPEDHLILHSRNGKSNKNALLFKSLRFGHALLKSSITTRDIRKKFLQLR